MRLVRLLPERWQKFIHEALKFGIVGGINTVINYAVFNALALTVFRDGQLKATVIATIVATITSYLMNRHWTYRDRPKSAMKREYALFFLFNASGLVIELGVLAAAKYGLGITSLLALNVAKTAGVLLATLFRFWSYRTFVFQPAPAHAEQTWHDVPRDEWDTMAELDPVAELAESVTDLEEADRHRSDRSPADPVFKQPQARAAPLDAGLGRTVGGLEAEFAAELHAGTHRSRRR
ncbi:GtrA family protein [Micromonospora sp. NPDC050686]|uniref:GtrA family protein n=1 Tax=Micromonospora sp. NPDC050686 TaxID=3154631 RepID=UPI0033D15742